MKKTKTKTKTKKAIPSKSEDSYQLSELVRSYLSTYGIGRMGQVIESLAECLSNEEMSLVSLSSQSKIERREIKTILSKVGIECIGPKDPRIDECDLDIELPSWDERAKDLPLIIVNEMRTLLCNKELASGGVSMMYLAAMIYVSTKHESTVGLSYPLLNYDQLIKKIRDLVLTQPLTLLGHDVIPVKSNLIKKKNQLGTYRCMNLLPDQVREVKLSRIPPAYEAPNGAPLQFGGSFDTEFTISKFAPKTIKLEGNRFSDNSECLTFTSHLQSVASADFQWFAIRNKAMFELINKNDRVIKIEEITSMGASILSAMSDQFKSDDHPFRRIISRDEAESRLEKVTSSMKIHEADRSVYHAQIMYSLPEKHFRAVQCLATQHLMGNLKVHKRFVYEYAFDPQMVTEDISQKSICKWFKEAGSDASKFVTKGLILTMGNGRCQLGVPPSRIKILKGPTYK